MLEVSSLLARRYHFSIARNVGGKMCVYVCDLGVFRFTNKEIPLYCEERWSIFLPEKICTAPEMIRTPK